MPTDRERLDWLEAGSSSVDHAQPNGKEWWQVSRLDNRGRTDMGTARSLRRAIDNAMSHAARAARARTEAAAGKLGGKEHG